MTSPEVSTEQAVKMSELSKLGFIRLMNSSIMQNADAFLDVKRDGSNELMVSYGDIPGMTWQEVTGIKAGSLAFDEFGLILGNEAGDVSDISQNGSRSNYDEAIAFTRETSGVPIIQQLKDSGFEQVDMSGNVFKIHVKQEDFEGDFVAIVENGKIIHMLKPVDEDLRAHLGSDFKILSIRKENDKYGDQSHMVLSIQKDPMQFEMTTEYDGALLYGTQKLLRSISETELGLKPVEKIMEPSGFVIGGKNSSELILGLTSLAGQRISILETRMRPHLQDTHSSLSGFLGDDESLVKILAEDNDYVLSHGLTHQELAAPLFYVRKHIYAGFGNEFEYRGFRYKVKKISTHGEQESPFRDGTKTSSDLVITNIDTGKIASCSALLPDMMARYGFYEGKGTPYRLEPSTVMNVFGLLK